MVMVDTLSHGDAMGSAFVAPSALKDVIRRLWLVWRGSWRSNALKSTLA